MSGNSFKVGLVGGIAAMGLFGAGAAGAAPPVVPPVVPGPADPGYCGAHSSPWNCWSDISPARPGEVAFINQRLRFTMAGIPTDQTRLLQLARGICQSLVAGTGPNYIVKWLAEDLGASEGQTGQMFVMAKGEACPSAGSGSGGGSPSSGSTFSPAGPKANHEWWDTPSQGQAACTMVKVNGRDWAVYNGIGDFNGTAEGAHIVDALIAKYCPQFAD